MRHKADPDAPVVVLCAGKDCRHSSEFASVRRALDQCSVVETRCLDICNGPVVIVEPTSQDAIVLSKLRAAKDVRDLERLVSGRERITPRLQRRRVTGSKRRAALRRAVRALRR